jgi:drug/metabolite transporter (DMT)-like permease
VNRSAALGAVFATTTAVTWGGQFVVGKSALARVDPFPLTAIRYAIAAGVLLGVLWLVEGRRALRTDGKLLPLAWLGALGFAGFNLFAYTGLAHARPQSASLIVALAPLLTALVLWARDGTRPSRITFGALGVALVGVALVVSRGHPSSIWNGSIGWGDALVFAGVLSFVVYTLGAARFGELSPLRYTALTAALGWPAIMAATIVATGAGWITVPSGGDVWAIGPQIAYLALPGAVVAVVTWNAAVERLGPQNAVLFGNLIPVTTFVIEIVRGYRPVALELGGAALTIGALVANNVLGRRSAVVAVERGRQEPLREAA